MISLLRRSPLAALSPSIRPDRQTIRSISRAAFERSGNGGTVSVRAYDRMRNGKTEHVGAHQRSDPPGGEHTPVIQAMARRPGPQDDPRGKPIPLEGAPGMSNRGSGPASRSPLRRNDPANAAPSANPPSTSTPQPLSEILAPGGQPIGTVFPGARPFVRTLPGGDPAARQFFRSLTEGRGGTDITPPGFNGQIIRLPDGNTITYRPISTSGPPAVDTNIPSLRQVIRRIHFN